MPQNDDASKLDTLAKLAQSRAEIRSLLEPPLRRSARGSRGETGEQGEDRDADAHEHGGDEAIFPRSRTMRLLLSGRGIGTVGAIIGGLILARPALAFRLLRMLPAGAIARMLLVKAFSAVTRQRV